MAAARRVLGERTPRLVEWVAEHFDLRWHESEPPGHPPGWSLAVGHVFGSPTEMRHAVVCHDGWVVHDPSAARGGLRPAALVDIVLRGRHAGRRSLAAIGALAGSSGADVSRRSQPLGASIRPNRAGAGERLHAARRPGRGGVVVGVGRFGTEPASVRN